MSATGALTQPAGGADSPLCATEAGGSRRWHKRTSRRGKSDEKSLQSHSGGNPGPHGCSSSSLTYISWAQSFSGKKFLLPVWTPSNWFMKESQSLISTNTNKTSCSLCGSLNPLCHKFSPLTVIFWGKQNHLLSSDEYQAFYQNDARSQKPNCSLVSGETNCRGLRSTLVNENLVWVQLFPTVAKQLNSFCHGCLQVGFL